MSVFGKCRGGGRRAASRETTPAIAVITTVTKSHAAVLIDVSTTGARLRSSVTPDSGEELIMTVETIRAFGSVAWVENDQFGVAFDAQIPPEQVQQLQRQVSRSRGLSPEIGAALEDWLTGLAR